MIVPMRKATILCETRDADAMVKDLRKLGVLHIEHQNPPEGRDISVLLEKAALIDSSLEVLNRATASENTARPQKTLAGDWQAVADHLIALSRRQESLESSKRNLLGRINEWEQWGDIDIAQVEHLRRNGIYLKLYQVPVKEIASFPEDIIVRTVFTAGDFAYCVAISRRQFDYAFTEIPPPKESLSRLREQLAGTHKELEMITAEVIENACYYEDLARVKKKIDKEIEFRQVLSGMGQEGAICYVTGYIPSDRQEHLIAHARSSRWGIAVSDPSDEDNVPTLLRNPAWVDRIRPVFELLGLTPGYRELDVSVPFLVFFSIFFGILIGDAGYGLVYILLTLVLQKKLKPDAGLKTTFSLFYLLGSCALVWGILTGTFFGQTWLLNAGFRPLVPQLNDAGIMQTFCFFLGALHLSIAHSWRAYLKLPSLTALADAGWICVLWTAFFVARTLILGDAFPSWVIWLFAAGIVLVILFTSPQAHVLRGIGQGIGTVALSLMNNFTDVISYIRLFAVGLATLAIAETTNTLASGFGEGAIALAAGAVIILTGHSLNIILGPMSVLVHGVRLNVLEFSGHANVTWSGFSFEPLKE